ncbi:MAG TPA: hypothetical protein DIC53_11235 [Synergistaceae bacterium]|jgi:hypothetical protein|nr:hypothetical protein [Synergistaceae bacterium]
MKGRKIFTACMILLACALPAAAATTTKQDAMEEFGTVANWCLEQIRSLEYEEGIQNVLIIRELLQTVDTYNYELKTNPDLDVYNVAAVSGAFNLALHSLQAADKSLYNDAGNMTYRLADWRSRSFPQGRDRIIAYLKRGETIRGFAEKVLAIWEDRIRNPGKVVHVGLGVLHLEDAVNNYDREALSGELRNLLTRFILQKVSMKDWKEATFLYADSLGRFVEELQESVKELQNYVEEMTDALEGGKTRTRLAVVTNLRDIVEALHGRMVEFRDQAKVDIEVTYNDKEFCSFLESLSIPAMLDDIPLGLLAMVKRVKERVRYFEDHLRR